MFQIIAYIQFLLRSTNQHGVHSPFVYDLVTQCFYDKTYYPEYANLKTYRQALLGNTKRISVQDFGSGSRVFNSNERSISAMATHAGTSLKRAQLLYRLVRYFKPQTTLELGTSLGIATQAMALGQPNNYITSIEGCSNTAALAREQLSKTQANTIEVITGDFDTVLPQLKAPQYDLIFIDGNHNKAATLRYFKRLINKAHNDSIFIFDDIYWSKDMRDAWQEITAHPKVTVTVDTFFWGIVSFRKEQAKENFTIRV